jgi:hypothetical protein
LEDSPGGQEEPKLWTGGRRTEEGQDSLRNIPTPLRLKPLTVSQDQTSFFHKYIGVVKIEYQVVCFQ